MLAQWRTATNASTNAFLLRQTVLPQPAMKGVCALDESQYLPTSAIPFCGNPRSLVVKVGEAASCVYRMTKISVTKRHYRCSECETITEAASAKKWSKLITTCGSITSPHDP
ncbi:unnamed protein product [Toxocara canis]|uniref:Transposase n=1 Tax=Toxocara canis TaxID=6265 RepID=A0A183U2T1_TOXCA|nr:unnamed protein product [Toxocara canis]